MTDMEIKQIVTLVAGTSLVTGMMAQETNMRKPPPLEQVELVEVTINHDSLGSTRWKGMFLSNGAASLEYVAFLEGSGPAYAPKGSFPLEETHAPILDDKPADAKETGVGQIALY